MELMTVPECPRLCLFFLQVSHPRPTPKNRWFFWVKHYVLHASPGFQPMVEEMTSEPNLVISPQSSRASLPTTNLKIGVYFVRSKRKGPG